MTRLVIGLCLVGLARAQNFTYRGYLETRLTLYPQAASNDRGRAVSEAVLRWEASWAPSPALRLFGSFDARADTHRQVERRWQLRWQDRGLERPAFAVRRLSASYQRGPLTAELGKRLLRWGRTDILNPTDRFAPRDYLSVVDTDLLGVTAARVAFETPSTGLELVWAPRFTPSRAPLLNQRWVVAPEGLPAGAQVRDGGSRFPGGPQFGARWTVAGGGFEGALAFYEGFNHLPLIDATIRSLIPLRADFQRFYPKLRMYGGDLVIPLPWFLVKAEAGWFTSPAVQADEYVLYVVQVEKTIRDWVLVGGYAGEAVTDARNTVGFAPDRGLTRAVLGRAAYTIDANRSLAVEAALRQNGDGAWTRWEYTQAFGQHWRMTGGFAWIRGAPGDFLGQYRRNSHGSLAFRYSF